MKSSRPTLPPSQSKQSWLLPILIGIGAAGAGVSGTLLWMQSRAPAASSLSGSYVPVPPSTSGAPAAADDTSREPPSTLTAGMAPAQAALTQANWFYDHEAWPRAAALYQQAITGGLDNPDVRTDFGSALRFAGDPQKALEQYRLAQKQDPSHENSLFNQGGVYASDLKQLDKGIVLWRKYLQAFPNGKSSVQARQLIVEAQKRLLKKPAIAR